MLIRAFSRLIRALFNVRGRLSARNHRGNRRPNIGPTLKRARIQRVNRSKNIEKGANSQGSLACEVRFFPPRKTSGAFWLVILNQTHHGRVQYAPHSKEGLHGMFVRVFERGSNPKSKTTAEHCAPSVLFKRRIAWHVRACVRLNKGSLA